MTCIRNLNCTSTGRIYGRDSTYNTGDFWAMGVVPWLEIERFGHGVMSTEPVAY